MSKIFIPMHYHSKDLNISLSGENVGYELRKSFSPDLREYSKIQNGANVDFSYSNINTSIKTGLLFLTDTLYLEEPGNNLILRKSTISSLTSSVTLTSSNIYGDTQYTGGITKTLREYSIESVSSYKYYRMNITGETSVHKFYYLSFGIVYDLPDTFRLIDKTYSKRYPLSVVDHNLNGSIYFDGWQNNGTKTEHTLQFEYLNNTDKENLIEAFKFGKGGLPVWFIDDETDSNTWFLTSMKKMTIEEPVTEYYTVNIELRNI